MRTLAPLAVALLLLTGCTASTAPNDIDAQRLDALAAEPLLLGGAETAASETARASVFISNDWSFGGGSETWELTSDLVNQLRADGWLITQQNCDASEAAGLISAQLVAIKDLDGFTAGMLVKVNVDGAKMRAYAPFHLEDPNPWKPTRELTDGCLDGEEPTSPTMTGVPSDLAEH